MKFHWLQESPALAFTIVALLGAALLLERAVIAARPKFERRFVLTLIGAGALVGCVCLSLEYLMSLWTGPRADPLMGDELGGMLTVLAFAAPLEEGAKLLLLRRYARRQQRTAPRATFLLLAVWLSLGFAVVEAVYGVALGQTGDSWLRLVLMALGHLFFAGIWAVAVGDYFPRWGLVWVIATVFHALFDYLVGTSVGRGWLLLLPVLASALGVTWLGLRNLRQRPFLAIDTGPARSRMLRMFVAEDRERAPMHWVVGGAFVTTGVVIASLAVAIYLGHRLGLDFALADEADGRADGPIVLLASSLATAFPFSGYLIARASGTTSVIEPAMGAALAIVVVVALLSVTAPVAVIFALAVAPLAFGLACLGAWFGVR